MARFTEVFKVVRRRSSRCGSKSIPGDVFDWRGEFRGRVVLLRSTVRTTTGNASFHTMSNARISYGSGRVEADTKFVDVEVLAGELLDEELEVLASLAQAEDTRTVRVRRSGDPVRSGVVARIRD